jgi:hypothetical protein
VDLNVLISGNNGEIDLELAIDGNYDGDAYKKHRLFNESDHFLAQDKPKCSPKNTLLVVSSLNIREDRYAVLKASISVLRRVLMSMCI